MKNIVASAVFLKNNHVLLEKRKESEDNYAGLWSFPGGHKEKTEDIEETLCREMREELKIKVLKYKPILTLRDIDPTSKEPYEHHAFLCIDWIGEIKGTTEEEKVRWVKISDIPNIGKTSKIVSVVLKELKHNGSL